MRLITLFTLALLAGCAVSAPPLPEEIASTIPEGANTVELHTAMPVDDLYEEARNMLVKKGFKIRDDDDRSWRIETEPMEVGSRTDMRITLRASPIGNGSRIEAIGHWSSDTGDAGFAGAGAGVSSTNENWYQAVWGENQRSSSAFGQLVLIMNDLPHVEAVYAKR
ncbi:MAG: hypothetical protein R2834_18130 [Rhodothermales bacterium]